MVRLPPRVRKNGVQHHPYSVEIGDGEETRMVAKSPFWLKKGDAVASRRYMRRLSVCRMSDVTLDGHPSIIIVRCTRVKATGYVKHFFETIPFDGNPSIADISLRRNT